MRSRLTGRMAFFAEHGASNLWVKWYLVVLAAIIANYVKALWRDVARHSRLFSPALCTALWRHHIALVKHLLFFFCEQKDLFTLNTRNFYVRHRCTLLFTK